MKPLKDNEKNTNMSNKGLEVYSIQKLPNYHNVPGHEQLVDIAHKSEKITTAVYMITDLIPEHDPLVHSLRETSVSIMGLLFEMISAEQTERIEGLSEVAGNLYGLSSYLQVIYHNGRISDMNYELLVSEITKLQNRIDVLVTRTMPYDRQKRSSRLVDEFTFTDTFFETGYESVRTAPKQAVEVKDIEEVTRDTEKERLMFKKTAPKKQLKQKVLKQKNVSLPQKGSQQKTSQRHTGAPSSKTSDAKEERQDNIIKILKQKKDAKIGDLTSLMSDIGSKTIQRDLNELVKKGLVTKAGERRWSVYNLAY